MPSAYCRMLPARGKAVVPSGPAPRTSRSARMPSSSSARSSVSSLPVPAGGSRRASAMWVPAVCGVIATVPSGARSRPACGAIARSSAARPIVPPRCTTTSVPSLSNTPTETSPPTASCGEPVRRMKRAWSGAVAAVPARKVPSASTRLAGLSSETAPATLPVSRCASIAPAAAACSTPPASAWRSTRPGVLSKAVPVPGARIVPAVWRIAQSWPAGRPSPAACSRTSPSSASMVPEVSRKLPALAWTLPAAAMLPELRISAPARISASAAKKAPEGVVSVPGAAIVPVLITAPDASTRV